MYDFARAVRAAKKGEEFGDPRSVGCEFEKLFEESKTFYKSLAKFHLFRGGH